MHLSLHLRQPPRGRFRPARSGFTLIELLVVIAIISILASMLFPAFSRARESARKIVCISNLKQVGYGIYMYVQDYDERFPVGHPFWGPGAPQPQLSQTLYTYTKSYQVWNCPSWTGVYVPDSDAGNFSFLTDQDRGGFPNNAIGVPLPPPLAPLDPASLAALGQPAQYPLLFCGVAPQQASIAGVPGPGAINAHTGLSDGSWQDPASGLIGGTNILFGDMHAKYLPLTRSSWNELYTTPLRGG